MSKIIAFGAILGLVMVPAAAFASVDITLSGGTVIITQGQSYNEPGYSAFSTVDGDVTSLVSVSNPGTAQAGTFSIDYSVTDSALDSAFASRTLVVRSNGAMMPWCSGPLAPGWNAGLPGGGCGGTEIVVPAGSAGCPFFIVGGCIVRQ